MPKYIDVSNVSIPKGFFEQNLNVPKLLDWLNSQPAAEVAPVVHARWIHWPRKVFAQDGSYALVMDTSCSKCNWRIPEGMDSSFCPRCGARMDEMVPAKDG